MANLKPLEMYELSLRDGQKILQAWDKIMKERVITVFMHQGRMTDEELYRHYEARYGKRSEQAYIITGIRKELLNEGVIIELDELGIDTSKGEYCSIYELKEYT